VHVTFSRLEAFRLLSAVVPLPAGIFSFPLRLFFVILRSAGYFFFVLFTTSFPFIPSETFHLPGGEPSAGLLPSRLIFRDPISLTAFSSHQYPQLFQGKFL